MKALSEIAGWVWILLAASFLGGITLGYLERMDAEEAAAKLERRVP